MIFGALTLLCAFVLGAFCGVILYISYTGIRALKQEMVDDSDIQELSQDQTYEHDLFNRLNEVTTRSRTFSAGGFSKVKIPPPRTRKSD